MALHASTPGGWSLQPEGPVTRARRGAAATAPVAGLPQRFLRDGVAVEATWIAQSPPARRGAAPPPDLDVQLDCTPDERAVLAVRHPSGALTFHTAIERVQARRSAGSRGSGPRGASARFRIALPTAPAPATGTPVRRGLVSRVVKIIVLKIKEAVIDAAVRQTVEFAALGAETLWWKARHLEEGWFEVDGPSLVANKLRRANPGAWSSHDRALLLLHGTFSHAQSAFGPLAVAPGGFFAAARELYGDRIFAFNHFTLSRDPEENARMLLAALPARPVAFDVITHSRGGLVLRQLVERRDALGGLASRFSLGHAVLVASPNAGTPLATGQRWEDTFGAVANLLEMFPDNPLTTAAEFVANGIVWLAGHVTQDLPGLASMDANGGRIADLQAPPGPDADAYSALVANYNPSGSVLQRLADAGIDGFFAGANDLVVPTAGGWQIDSPTGAAIPGERIGCFGRGGNLFASEDSPVTHLNFFSQPDTVQFLLRALRRQAQLIPPANLFAPLPTRKLWRSSPATEVAVGTSSTRRTRPAIATAPRATNPPPSLLATDAATLIPPTRERGDDFHLMILRGPTPIAAAAAPGTPARARRPDLSILAIYGSARVLEVYHTRNRPEDERPTTTHPDATGDSRVGGRFREIIARHESIKLCLAGRADADGHVPDLPDEATLRHFGENLFEVLLTGSVRRLYDVARSETRDGPLNVILTCTVPWLADKPWEFAVDPARQKFLVTEEIHFVRNVLTAVPAQRVPPRRGPLRLLVVAAQPVGAVELSGDDEIAMIRRGFQRLIDAGLAVVDVLARAAPADLHRQMQAASYDIVHFIGHGEFDDEAHKGILLFESADGGIHEVNTRTMREILCDRGVQLVFLNACESGRGARDVLNAGVAQALMEAGMPAVVANQYKVLDPSAVSFSEHFYWSLAQGATLGEAAREARIALNYSIDGEVIDWAIPVLYARDPDFRFTVPGAHASPTPPPPPPRRGDAPTTVPTRGRTRGRSADRKNVRIGVADLAQVFPGLDETLALFNAVQDHFEFSTARVVAPLGAWHVGTPDADAEAETTYLYANRFAQKLRAKPRALGVDYLACITNWPMVCDYSPREMWYNIYGWWPDADAPKEKDLPVVLFSVADLPIPPRGPTTDQILANSTVEALTGLLANQSTHRRGPRNCPLYMNIERDIQVMQARMHFCKPCHARLKKLLPADLPALDAILGAFDR